MQSHIWLLYSPFSSHPVQGADRAGELFTPQPSRSTRVFVSWKKSSPLPSVQSGDRVFHLCFLVSTFIETYLHPKPTGHAQINPSVSR